MNDRGFTIIELLIATAIFAVILIITSTTIIGISQTYVKGSVQGQTQQTARAVLSDVSQDIQFNEGNSISSPSSTTAVAEASNASDAYYFCVGSDVYVFQLDKYLTTSASLLGSSKEYSNWALIRYSSTICPSTSTVPTSLSGMPAGSEELLAANERLGGLNVSTLTTGGLTAYNINLEVGYGANDLLNDTNMTNPNVVNGASSAPIGYQYSYQCGSGLDSSFCAVSTLTTTVSPRIN